MNKISLIAILLIFSSFSNQKNSKRSKEILKIEIFSTDYVWGSPMIVRVCDKYETSEGSWELKYETNNRFFIDKIKYYLDTSMSYQGKFRNFDVKAKLFIHYASKEIDTVCLIFSDYYYLNGEFMKCRIANERLLYYVDSFTQEMIIKKKVIYRSGGKSGPPTETKTNEGIIIDKTWLQGARDGK